MKIEKVENGLAKLTIESKGEKFETLKKNALAKFKDQKVDGFRAGHVPADVLEQKFSKEIKSEVLNALISEEYRKALEDKKVEPVSGLVLDKEDFKKDSVKVELLVAVQPEFAMPKYTGLDGQDDRVMVTEKEIEAELGRILEGSKTKEELPKSTKAENGFEADIDFEGFTDGKAFEGGKGEHFPLVLGSGQFIPGFEDQILGHKAGEEFDVNVKFPDEYHAPNLKGKEATFKVKLNKLSKFVTPEANDEFAKSKNFDSLDAYKADIKEKIREDKKFRAKNKKINEILTQLKDSTDLTPVELLVNEEVNNELNALNGQLTQAGMNFAQYLEMSGKTFEELRKEMTPRATDNVKLRFILSRLADENGIKVEKEDVTKEYENAAKAYGMSLDQFKAELQKANYTQQFEESSLNRIMHEKIMNFLYENN